MPIQVIQRRNPNRQYADAIQQGTQGFIQGRQMRQQREEQTLANAYKQAQIDEIQRKTQALDEPVRPGYFRDAYSGELKDDLEYIPQFSGNGSSGGGLIAKSFKVGKMDYLNPAYAEYELEQKRKEEAQKPLSGESAGRFAGAKQSLEKLQEIDELTTPENFKKMKEGVGKIRMSTTLGLNRPGSIKGNLANFVTAGTANIPFKTDDDQKKFELAVNLIAENNVRAKSGAAVPTPEQIKEEARQLLSDDSFVSFANRMATSRGFASTMADELRPGTSKKYSATSPEDFSSISNEELRRIAAGA